MTTREEALQSDVEEVQCAAFSDGIRLRCAECDASWPLGETYACLRKARKTAPDYLEAAAATFRERNAIYGSNYQRQGAALLALFPEGGIPAIVTEEDANRLHIFIACVTKLQRYAHSWGRGGHKDSAHDLMVYAAMLEEMTGGQ